MDKKTFMEYPFVKWILGLWDNSPQGASIRKALAVWVMVLITRLHNKYLADQVTKTTSGATNDWNFGETLLYADYIMIGLLIGFIVFQDIIKFKLGKNDTNGQEKPSNTDTNPS